MKQTTLTTIGKFGSVLLLVFTIPWFVYGQGMGGGGMPGMGGGVMGLDGGMGGYESPREKLLEELAKNPVTWERPAGEIPFWLKNGKVACDSYEFVRDKLNKTVEIDVSATAMEAFFEILAEKTEIQFDLDTRTFEEQGLSLDTPLTVKGVSPVRETLRRALEPLKLTYIVHENTVEITTIDIAKGRPVLRYYDLGYVQPDSKNIASIVSTIEQAVEPETWLVSGGTGSIMPIGQLLVVSATEKAHLGIEKLLYRLSPRSASEPVKTANIFPSGRETTSPKKSSSIPLDNLASISGVVTRRGKPLVAEIGLHSSGMIPFTTTTSNDGKYVLKNLPIGSYKITLNGNGVPPKYRNFEDSLFTCEVKNGVNPFDISISD